MLKRLIGVALPLKEVSEQSAREKSIRHGHISTLHIWWARRPLAACRAAVFASLILAGPRRVHRNWVAMPLGLHHPGKLNRVFPGQRSVRPVLRESPIVAIDPQPPCAGKVPRFLGRIGDGDGPGRQDQGRQTAEKTRQADSS